MGQSLLQEGEAGHICMPFWTGYLPLDYKKGVKPQLYSCPKVTSSEAFASLHVQANWGNLGFILSNRFMVMAYVVCV